MKLRRMIRVPIKNKPFQLAKSSDRIRTNLFKNGGSCVSLAMSSGLLQMALLLKYENKLY